MTELEQENFKLKEENEAFKKQIEELSILAYTDKFTGCYNRAWFYENIKNDKEYYLTLADVNCLRTINFVLGHEAGDQLIMESVDTFKKYGDVVRQGGDEFIIISYDKKNFDELNSIPTNKFSLGGCHKGKNMSIAAAFKLADKALFDNKKYNKTGGSYEDI